MHKCCIKWYRFVLGCLCNKVVTNIARSAAFTRSFQVPSWVDLLTFFFDFFFFFSVLLGVGMELIHFWTGFFYLLFDTGTGLHLFVIPFVLILFCGSFCFMPWLKCTLGGNGHESLFQIVTILIFTGKWNSNKICVFPFGMWIDQTVPLYLAFQSWKWRLIIQWTRTILHAHFLR